MKKRVIIFLLVALVAASVTLPALASGAVGGGGPGSAGASGRGTKSNAQAGTVLGTEAAADSETEAGPVSFFLLDGVSQSAEYELRNGTTYVTVSSFVAMADPQAVVTEANGVVTASSSRDGETLSLKVSTQLPYLIANGRYLYAKNNITTVNGHVAVPVRKLAEVFNLNVYYDAGTNQVLLTHVQGSGAYIQPGDSYYNSDAVYWLSRIIYTESGNQSLEGKIAVGNVVMNRVNSSLFPNNIYDVLNQKNQFIPCSTLSRYTPNSDSVVAAKLVLEGVQVVPSALFFARAGLVCYASVNRPYVTTIGAHAFYA